MFQEHLNNSSANFFKQFIRLFLPLFIAISLLASGSTWAFFSHEYIEAKENLTQKAMVVEKLLLSKFKHILFDFLIFKGFDGLNQETANAPSQQGVIKALQMLQKLQPGIDNILLYDHNWVQKAQIGKKSSVFLDELINQIEVNRLSQNAILLTISKSEPEPYLYLTQKLGVEGKQGFLLLSLRLQALLDEITSSSLGKGVQIAILDADYRPLVNLTPAFLQVDGQKLASFLKTNWYQNQEGAYLTRNLLIPQLHKKEGEAISLLMKGQLKLTLFQTHEQMQLYNTPFALWLWSTYGGLSFLLLLYALGVTKLRLNQEQDQQHIAESEKHYRLVVEEAKDGILILQKQKILFGNQQAAKMLECPESELHDQWISTFLHPQSSSELKKALSSDRPQENKTVQSMIKSIAGSELQVEVSISAIQYLKAPAILAIMRDVTERKQMVERLFQAMKETEMANRAKSQFLANMSHEVRTPMNVIMGMSTLLLESETDKDKKDNIKIIHSACESLLQTISEILDLSKIDAGSLELQETPFHPFEEISNLVQTKEEEAKAKGLKLSLRISKEVPSVLRGDAARMKQVLMNLLSNALKFTKKGEVRIRVEVMQLDQDLVKLKFEVSDTGIGIPLDRQDRIFDVFTQGDGSATREYGGTGLGLSISKNLVAMMGGEIWVESTPREGSHFYFTLCALLGEPMTTTNIKREVISNELSGIKILIVEDKELNQTLTKRMLEQFGATTEVAGNGEEALSILKSGNRFDLILMDIQMPVMDGITATNLIRSNTNGSLNPEVPIIALTAHALREDKQECLNAGMNDYLAKPVNMEELRQMIKRNLTPTTKTDR